jgi:hypothetical protein
MKYDTKHKNNITKRLTEELRRAVTKQNMFSLSVYLHDIRVKMSQNSAVVSMTANYFSVLSTYFWSAFLRFCKMPRVFAYCNFSPSAIRSTRHSAMFYHPLIGSSQVIFQKTNGGAINIMLIIYFYYYYQLMHSTSVYFYMSRLTIVAIIRESLSTDGRSLQYAIELQCVHLYVRLLHGICIVLSMLCW